MRKLRRSPLLPACALALLLAACSGGSTEDMLASAKGYLAKKDYKAAIIQLKNALQKQPDSGEARFLLGEALLESGDASTASEQLHRAIELKYPASQALPLLAKAFIVSRQDKTLTDEFENTELPDPTANADLKTSIAAAHAALGNVDKSASALQAALKSVPGYPPALILQARAKADRRQYDDALAILDKVLASAPSNVEAWHFKGELLLFSKGDKAGARAAYEKSLTLRPDFSPARSSMISLLLAQRDLPGAEAQIAELRKVLPNRPQTMYYEAQLAYLKEDNGKARDLAQQLLKVAPDNPKVLQLAGAIAFNTRSLLQAENYLGKALQIMPDLPVARALLAQAELRSGDPAKALSTLEPLLANDNPDAESFSLAGEAYLQSGQLRLAEANFARAAKINPGDSKARTALALTQMTDGNADTIFAQLRSISSSATDTYADLALVSASLRRNDLDTALKAIDTIEKKQPNKPLAANLRGRVFLLRRDTVRARASFERALEIDPVYVPAVASLADIDLAENKPEAAKKRFDSVLASDPKNVNALVAIAGLQARAGGSKEEVAGLLASAVKLNPGEIAPRLLLVDHYLAKKDFEPALLTAQDAVVALPESLELLDALGRAQLAAGQTNQALSTFNKLAGLKSDSPDAQLRLASVYLIEKNPSAATQSFKRALQIKPDLLIAQQGLVELLIAAKHPDEAVQTARIVQKQRPVDPAGYLLEAAAEGAQSHFATAADAYRAALKRSASTETAMKLHSTLGIQKKDSEADDFAATWLKDRPKDATFLFYLGEVSLGRGNLPAAEDYFQRVLALKADNALALNNLAWVMAKLKKPGAVNYAERANALLPDRPALMDTLATALAAEHQIEQAIATEKKALALSAGNPTLRLALAKLYIQSGDKASARIELEALAKLSDKFSSQAEVGQLLGSL